MSERPSGRHIHEAVGGFMIVMLLVFMVFVIRSAFLHHWFASARELAVRMPEEGSFGLVEGSEVIVLGTRAGFVDRITFGADKRMHAIIEIREDFTPYVKRDSRIRIRKTYGIAGETYLALLEPEPDPNGSVPRRPLEPLDWGSDKPQLEAKADRTATERLEDVLEDIGSRLYPAIDSFREGIDRWTQLADYLQSPQRDFGPVLSELKATASQLNEGRGALGRLLVDEQMGRDLTELLARMDTISQDAVVISGHLREEADQLPGLIARLQQTMTDLQVFVSKIRDSGPATIDGIHDAANRLPGLILQAQEAVRDIERLAEALQQRFAPDSIGNQPGSRLSPEESAP